MTKSEVEKTVGTGKPANDNGVVQDRDIIKASGNTASHMEPGDYMRMGNKYVSWEFLMST